MTRIMLIGAVICAIISVVDALLLLKRQRLKAANGAVIISFVFILIARFLLGFL